MPFGVSPNGNDFLPSGAVTSATTKFHVPTIPSFKLAGCAAVAPADSASASKAAMVLNIMVPPGEMCRRLSYPGSHCDVLSFRTGTLNFGDIIMRTIVVGLFASLIGATPLQAG